MALNAGVDQSQTTSRILNKLIYAMSEIAEDISTAATGDIVFMIDVSDGYKIKYADATNVKELIGLDALTATAAEINASSDVSGRHVDIGDETSYTALAANSGKPHTIPDLTANLTITLPAVAAGLEFRFMYAGVAADAQNWIIDTGSDTNFYLGGLVHLDTDAGSGGDEVVPIAGDGNSNSKLTVVTPDVGTEIYMVCDGTNWILSGRAVSATVPSFADQ